MSDVESDYSDYENAKAEEGGLHEGRSEPSRGLILSLAIGFAALVAIAVALSRM